MKNQKRPVVFTILGVLALLGGLWNLATGVLAMIYIPAFAVFFILYSVLPGIIAIIQGIGTLKLKKWLPYLALITFVLPVALIIFGYLNGEPVLMFEVVAILVAGVITGYIFYKRELFVN